MKLYMLAVYHRKEQRHSSSCHDINPLHLVLAATFVAEEGRNCGTEATIFSKSCANANVESLHFLTLRQASIIVPNIDPGTLLERLHLRLPALLDSGA